MKLNRKEIYNKDGDLGNVVGGNPTGLLNLNKVKYKWAYSLYKSMLAHTWMPQEVDMTQDCKDYSTLDKEVKLAYNKVLGHLIFLDSIQQNNIVDNINPFITSPEINMCLIRQAAEESLHAHSYAVMIDSITEEKDCIYELWREDDFMANKASVIADKYKELRKDEVTLDDILIACVANILLEGLYFYSGFTAIYAIAKSGCMMGSANMIKFIERDEGNSHLTLFTNIFKTIVQENIGTLSIDTIQFIKNMILEAVEIEVSWGNHICTHIPYFNGGVVREYIEFRANNICKKLLGEFLYNRTITNPIPWRKAFDKFNNQRVNFFEGTVMNYSNGLEW